MTVALRRGITAKTYYNLGTYGSPTWTNIPSINDWTVTAEWDTAEANSRATRVKLNAKTLLGLEVSGKLLATDNDPARAAIRAALLTDAVIDVMILDGDSATNGNSGFRFDAIVTAGTQDQGLGVVINDEIKLMPALTVNVPQSVMIASAAPVFTPLTP